MCIYSGLTAPEFFLKISIFKAFHLENKLTKKLRRQLQGSQPFLPNMVEKEMEISYRMHSIGNRLNIWLYTTVFSLIPTPSLISSNPV